MPELWKECPLEKRYYTLDRALKDLFGKKTAKLSLDGGMTCPNRDGTKGVGGCLFCGEKGSGDFTDRGSLANQLEAQAKILRRKWKEPVFIAYFQSFSNTYAPLERLRALWEEALLFEGVQGLAVATRCDCLPEDVLELLDEFNQRTFVWVELGLQTACDPTGARLNRGFSTDDFDKSVKNLSQRGIRTVAHLIAGLPGEGREDFLKSVSHVSHLPIWGVKLHMLHVLKDSPLFNLYRNEPFSLPDKETYGEWVCDALELLRPDIVIHRLTGDGKKENLEAPLWTLDKLSVITEIDREMNRRNSRQGLKSNSPDLSWGIEGPETPII